MCWASFCTQPVKSCIASSLKCNRPAVPNLQIVSENEVSGPSGQPVSNQVAIALQRVG